MIKISPVKCNGFKSRYYHFVVKDLLLTKFKTYLREIHDQPAKDRLKAYFTEDRIQKLVFSSARNLPKVINEIFIKFPEIADFYCPEIYLKGLVLGYTCSDIDDLELDNKNNIETLNKLYKTTRDDALNLLEHRPSKIISKRLNLSKVRRTATEKKNELKRLYNLKNGLAKRPTKGTDFPKWVANFHTVFDYNAMAKQFGYELSQLLDISVCPYCNQEDITTIHETDAEYRPAFDHFYPKSKFPFLATTLSNLIPAGERCNERYKAQSAMLSHENPYNKSISYEEPLFDFTTSAPSFYDKELQIKDVLVVVTDFNPDLTNNLELFKIEAVYNNKKFKNEFFKIRKCYNFLREQGNSGIDLNDLNSHNVDEIDHHFHVNLRVSPKTESMQKFKVDSLNKIAKSNFKMIK